MQKITRVFISTCVRKYQSELLKDLAVLKDVSKADLSTYSVLETGRHVWNEETDSHNRHGHHILENDNKQQLTRKRFNRNAAVEIEKRAYVPSISS